MKETVTQIFLIRRGYNLYVNWPPVYKDVARAKGKIKFKRNLPVTFSAPIMPLLCRCPGGMPWSAAQATSQTPTYVLNQLSCGLLCRDTSLRILSKLLIPTPRVSCDPALDMPHLSTYSRVATSLSLRAARLASPAMAYLHKRTPTPVACTSCTVSPLHT